MPQNTADSWVIKPDENPMEIVLAALAAASRRRYPITVTHGAQSHVIPADPIQADVFRALHFLSELKSGKALFEHRINMPVNLAFSVRSGTPAKDGDARRSVLRDAMKIARQQITEDGTPLGILLPGVIHPVLYAREDLLLRDVTIEDTTTP